MEKYLKGNISQNKKWVEERMMNANLMPDLNKKAVKKEN
jgi:hypothetical protein